MRWSGPILPAESAVSFHFQKFRAVKIRYILKKKKIQEGALEIVLESELLLSLLLQLNQIV